jgi:ribosomal protein L28
MSKSCSITSSSVVSGSKVMPREALTGRLSSPAVTT